MVEHITFNQYLRKFEVSRYQYELGIVPFESRMIYIPKKLFYVSFSVEGHTYTQSNITPFTIPLFYLN